MSSDTSKNNIGQEEDPAALCLLTPNRLLALLPFGKVFRS